MTNRTCCAGKLGMPREPLFKYMCFLNVGNFWSGFEAVRDFNNIKKPLVVKDFLKHLNESVIDSDVIVRMARNLDRQVIMLKVPPEQNSNCFSLTKGEEWDDFQI